MKNEGATVSRTFSGVQGHVTHWMDVTGILIHLRFYSFPGCLPVR